MKSLLPFQPNTPLGLTRICLACATLVSAAASEVGCPLKHGQWEPFPALTDEFDAGRLDESKWFPNNPSWLGRQPAYFNPKNVRVADGFLHLDAKKESLPNLRFSLNHCLSTATISGVARFARYVAMLMLAVWGLATMHCDLEEVPGLEFLACCQHPDTAPHQDNDCDTDACSVVESGFYKIEEQAASVPIPLLVLTFVLPLWEAASPTPTPYSTELLNCSPPELPRSWQFSYRTALPPRAPSLVA